MLLSPLDMFKECWRLCSPLCEKKPPQRRENAKRREEKVDIPNFRRGRGVTNAGREFGMSPFSLAGFQIFDSQPGWYVRLHSFMAS